MHHTLYAAVDRKVIFNTVTRKGYLYQSVSFRLMKSNKSADNLCPLQDPMMCSECFSVQHLA